MTEEDKIKEVLFKFEDGGLISRDLDKALSCLSDTIIGIGIGEQGFITSKEDVAKVFEEGMKEDSGVAYFLEFGRIEVRMVRPDTAVLCAEVIVTAKDQEKVTKSSFSQSLTLLKEEGWKICSLHASTPVVTEENIEAYPLKFAEKTLKSMREKIGEEVYAVEEQYRMAVLSDTIAFYIINFTTDTYEKCQLNSDLCAFVEEGSPYEQFAREHIEEYVVKEDIGLYLEAFSLTNIIKAFRNHEQEIKCEYRMLNGQEDSFIWVVTIIRLITDIATGEKKDIMYVKNIDSTKRRQIAMQESAEYDAMLKVYNRNTFIPRVDSLLNLGNGVFMMLDIDDFKKINDTYGHPFGDRVLIKIAEILRASFPEDTVFGRVGGDEFGIFLQGDCSREQIEEYMKILYDRISGFMPEEVKGSKVSCSVGIAFSKGTKSFSEFYQDADAALYRSKQKGKNCFSFFEDRIEK